MILIDNLLKLTVLSKPIYLLPDRAVDRLLLEEEHLEGGGRVPRFHLHLRQHQKHLRSDEGIDQTSRILKCRQI